MTHQNDHQTKMQRLKASVDRRIEAAQEEKGLVIVYTGAGKGKTTAALGMALRCLGHGMKVAIVQFIKGAIDTAEERVLKSFGDRVTFLRLGEGYTWETQDHERDTEFARQAWEQVCKFLGDPSYGHGDFGRVQHCTPAGLCRRGRKSCRLCSRALQCSMW